MNLRQLSGWFAAVIFGSVVATAQTPQSAAPAGDQKLDAAVITVSGCVQKEGDILKRPAVAGNVGMGDEFVLTNSSTSPSTATAEPPAAVRPDATAGTSGLMSNGTVYRVTGDKEKELKSYVGQRVEITGAFKESVAGAPREPGRAASSESSAAEVTSDKTPEISIVSIRPASGSCGAPVK